MTNKIIYTVGGLFLAIAILTALGLGIWTYELNMKLNATQKQLASLQSDYNKLKSDDAQVTSNLSQTSLTLNQTKSDLAKAQSELAMANSDKTGMRAKMDEAYKLMAVYEAALVNGENDTGISAKVSATGDSRLISLWKTLEQTPNSANGSTFDKYLIEAVLTDLR
jgi:septal ring factor EnvC (AmiA/AmiB activator)